MRNIFEEKWEVLWLRSKINNVYKKMFNFRDYYKMLILKIEIVLDKYKLLKFGIIVVRVYE